MLGLGLRPASIATLAQAIRGLVLPLSLPNGATFATDAPAGTVIWAAGNLPDGAAVTFSPNDGRVAVDNAGRLVVGLSASSAGTIAGSVTVALPKGGATKTYSVPIKVTSAVTNAYPTRPVITGTPMSGEMLTSYVGNLGAGAGQWYRAGAATGNTGATYPLTDADIGSSLTYRFTPSGGVAVESPPTDPVLQATYLVDEQGNRLVDEAGNFLTDGYNYSFVQLTDESGNVLTDENGDALCDTVATPVQQQVRLLVPYSPSSNTFNQLSLTTQPFTFAIADADRYVMAATGVPFQIYAPNMLRVEIWTAGVVVATLVGGDALGYFRGTLDLSRFTNGPRWFEVRAYDKSTVGGSSVAIFAGFHLFLTGGTNANTSALPAGAAGLALQWQDDFTSLSISRSSMNDGSTWYDQMPQGGNFGDQIFTAAASPQNPFQSVGSFLRIREQYDPNFAGGQSGTKHWSGGLLSTAFPDGTTSVQTGHGYYEARVLLPFGSGTWPAFWLLDKDRLSDPNKTYTSREQDIFEQYGPNMERFTASVHRYLAVSRADTQTYKIVGTPDLRWEFHRIGWLQTPNGVRLYFDDVPVMSDTYFKTSGPNDALNFILLNLALTPGPSNAPETVPPGSYHDMFVDSVRYYA